MWKLNYIPNVTLFAAHPLLHPIPLLSYYVEMIPNITLNHPPGPVRKLKNPPSRCSLTLFPHFGRTQFRRRRGTQSYVITSLNTHTVDFEELKFASSNITSLRMMDPKSFELRNAVSDWEEGEKRYNRFFRISPEYVKVSGAICVHCSRVYGNFLPPPPSTTDRVDCCPWCGQDFRHSAARNAQRGRGDYAAHELPATVRMAARITDRRVYEDGECRVELVATRSQQKKWITSTGTFLIVLSFHHANLLRKQSTASLVQLSLTRREGGRTFSSKSSSRSRAALRRSALGIQHMALITRGHRARWTRSGSKRCRTKLLLWSHDWAHHSSGSGKWIDREVRLS